MGYYIDLKTISIKDFRKRLENSDLLPSQKILKEFMEKGFKVFENCGLKTMVDLKETFKTKDKIKNFAQANKIPENYLIVLNREVNSYHPQARNIKDFKCLNCSNPGQCCGVVIVSLLLFTHFLSDVFPIFLSHLRTPTQCSGFQSQWRSHHIHLKDI